MRKHAARHVFPELGRVCGIDATARDELGYWKGTACRLDRFPNRHSSEGDRVLKSVLREYLMCHVHSRPGSVRRRGLLHTATARVFCGLGARNLSCEPLQYRARQLLR